MGKKSLADLRSVPRTRAERPVSTCLRPDLVARVQELTQELEDLPAPPRSRARKMAEGQEPENPRATEIRAELSSLLDKIEEHEGTLTLRANLDDGEWRRWADANPARGEDETGHDRDQRVTGGLVNADALLDSLGTFAAEWNGEPLGEDDWAEVLAPSIPHGDKLDMATAVVAMYEGRVDFRRWRSALSDSLQRYSDSASPDRSQSPRSDSTGGSPDESSEATT